MRQYAIDAARQIRLQSNVGTKVGSCLVKGGRILSLACNKSGKGTNTIWSRHAEDSLLLGKDAAGGTVYVYREHGGTGRLLNAKPCPTCSVRLREANVRQVFYTVDGGWEVMRLRGNG